MDRRGERKVKRIKSKSSVLLYIVYAVYLLYYLADMNTSANTVVKQTSERTSVHYYLVALIGILGIYYIFHGKIIINDRFRHRFFPLILWGACVDLINGVAFWSIATHIGLMVLFYLSLYFATVYVDTEEKYSRILFIELALWIITIYYGIRAYFSYSEYLGRDTNVLNMAYNVLVFIPLLLQVRDRRIRNVSLLVSIVYIIASLKRGAVLAMFGMFLVYYFNLGKSIAGKISIKKVIAGVVAVIGLVLLVLIVNNRMGGALFNRFSANELRFGSTRDVIYRRAFNVIKERGLVDLIIGTGSGSTMTLIGSGAHNEELELMISYGLIGLLIYFAMLLGGVIQFKILKRNVVPKLQPTTYLMSLTYIIIVGIVGSAMFSHMTYHIMIAMGLANSAYIVNGERKEIVDGKEW